jgi:hypothetical protein
MKMENQQITTTDQRTAQPPALTPEGERFALRQRQAKMFAMSPLVPEHLRKGTAEQAIANCWIALTLAEAMGEVPLIVMQNIHVVNGKAGFASQYMIARANSSGIFKGRIDWRIDRTDTNNLSVTAFATLKETGGEVSVTCDMNMAKAEGWTKNPKYNTMPEVMLRYRSAAFLVRFYAPDVMLGYHTVEEVEDVVAAAIPSAEPLTSKMLLDQSRTTIDAVAGEAVDLSTGEIIEDGANVTGDDTSREPVKEIPETEPETKPRGRQRREEQPKAEPEVAAEPNPPAPPPAEAAAPPAQEPDIKSNPGLPKAEEIVGRFAKAELLPDLDNIKKEHDLEIAAMNDELYEFVMSGYNRNRVRLGGSRVSTFVPEAAE